jgi:copper transport protein
VQLRGALLFVTFGLGIWQFLSEYGSERSPRDATISGQTLPALVMAALLLVVLGSISYQGHASQAPYHWAEVVADAVHLDSVAVWIGGLALVALTFWKLPRHVPTGGPGLAAGVLARFSGVATVAVGLAIATGVLRAVAELSAPQQLWDTAYGRSIVYKILLLCPVAFLAFHHRRVLVALRGQKRPGPLTLRMVRRSVAVELTLTIAIVVVAAVLVAQIPGRTV